MSTPLNQNTERIRELIVQIENLPDARESECDCVKSWNDLEDRPFYESVESVVLYSGDVNCTYAWNNEIFYGGLYEIVPNPVPLAVIADGDIIPVLFDGVMYDCPVEIDSYGEMTLGNRAMFRAYASATDFPFCVAIRPAASDYSLFVYGSGTHSLEVSMKNTIITTLDPKYLPKAVAVSNAAGDTVTGQEFNALLSALRDAGYLTP